MAVVGMGKKRDRDTFMTIELEFTFENESKPRRVGKHLSQSLYL